MPKLSSSSSEAPSSGGAASRHVAQVGRVARFGAGLATLALAAALALTPACAGANGAAGRPATAEKWFQRAQTDFQSADMEDARESIQRALAIAPTDPDILMLGAKIALARLEFAETLKLLKDVRTSEAAGMRGRALWYKGDLEAAADELEAMLEDPEVRDEWAKSIAKLARRGAGRVPFALSGSLLAAVEMPHVGPQPYFVVPVDIDGEGALALISTGTAEVVLDSSTRSEPSWVQLRFDKRFEVHDVPALAQDLSGISKQIGAPIKALLGVNLLRHLNVTLDYAGRQFVVRSFSPPAPPNATRLDVFYLRGGGMVLRGGLGANDAGRASLLVDTAMPFPIALDQGGWKKAGLDATTLPLSPDDPEQKLREGVVPMLRLGAYDVPKVPGVYGTPIAEVQKLLNLQIDGVIGGGLLAHFRMTYGDGGRMLWLEDEAAANAVLRGGAPPGGASPPPGGGAMPLPLDEPELPPGGPTVPGTGPAAIPPAGPKAPAPGAAPPAPRGPAGVSRKAPAR